MQIQIGCTVRLNCKLWQHTLGFTLLRYHHLFVYVMQTTIVNLLFCLFFFFLYKNTSAYYTSYGKEEETQSSYLRADLKRTT